MKYKNLKYKNLATTPTFIIENTLIAKALKSMAGHCGYIACFDYLLKYVKNLDDHDINKLDKACKNKKKSVETDINLLWRTVNVHKFETLDNKGMKKLDRMRNFKIRIGWIMDAVKQVRKEREEAILKEMEGRRSKIVEQGLEKFENYVENIVMEPDENIELPSCKAKCNRPPFRNRNKNKLLGMSTG